MRRRELEIHLITEDPSVMEDCLLELPPFGTFPMRGFRKTYNNDLDLFLDEIAVTKSAQTSSKTVAA